MAIGIVKTINGVKQLVPLTTDSGQGLPLGAWTSFEDDKPRNGYLKEGTTFDQSVYPALYNMLGTNVVPERFDHSRLGDCESITIGTSQATATEMQYDGFLVVNNTTSTSQSIYISSDGGTTWKISQGTSDASGKNASVIFRKGDKVYSASGASTTNFVRYYKHPMFIKAVIGPIEDSAADQVVQNVNNSRSYSTEEVNTGKKWIDGKPIYRKCFYSATNWANNAVIGNVSNFDNLVMIQSVSKNFSNSRLYMNYDDRDNINCASISVNGDVVVNRVGTFVGSAPAWVTIEYTKTTD